MKLIATMPVRNEAWVLGLSARVALQWCDALCILNHASCDRTVEIIVGLQTEFPGRVNVVSVPESTWTEMQHRQCLLDLARMKGATHIAIVDADEVLTSNVRLREHVERCPAGSILELPGYNLRENIYRYHADGLWGRRWFSTVFKDDPRLHWATEGYDHHHREPRGMNLNPYRPVRQGDGGVMHLWGITERRLRAKHALYKITERIKWPEKPVVEIDNLYSLAIRGNPPKETAQMWHYQNTPMNWWSGYGDLMHYLDLKAEPWQERECRRLFHLHGAQMFEGLDCFGVVNAG